jgi:hypothetical protein
MKKKKAAGSKAAKVRSLPAKKLSAKTAKGVKGGSPTVKLAKKGSETPTESVTFDYGAIKYEYK